MNWRPVDADQLPHRVAESEQCLGQLRPDYSHLGAVDDLRSRYEVAAADRIVAHELVLRRYSDYLCEGVLSPRNDLAPGAYLGGDGHDREGEGRVEQGIGVLEGQGRRAPLSAADPPLA